MSTRVYLFALLLPLLGCRHLLSDYDPLTMKSLTDVKPEVLRLYDSFTAPTVHQEAIAEVRLKLAQAHEYEHDKSVANDATDADIQLVSRAFERHVTERSHDGPWSQSFLSEKKKAISKLIDQAISHELMKPKG